MSLGILWQRRTHYIGAPAMLHEEINMVFFTQKYKPPLHWRYFVALGSASWLQIRQICWIQVIGAFCKQVTCVAMRSADTHRASACQSLLVRFSQTASRRWVATSIKRWKTLHHFSLFSSPLLLSSLFHSPSCCFLSSEVSQKLPVCARLRVHKRVLRFSLPFFCLFFCTFTSVFATSSIIHLLLAV
jgi:hypothetical protein